MNCDAHAARAGSQMASAISEKDQCRSGILHTHQFQYYVTLNNNKLRVGMVILFRTPWTRTCKNKFYPQILQSHGDHHVVPLGWYCRMHQSIRSPCISAVRPTIESARLPPRMLGGPRRHDTCARVLSQQPGVLQQAFLPTDLPPSPSAARGAARLADIEASGPLRTFS